MSNTDTAIVAAQASKEDVRTPASEFWRKFKKQKLAVGAGLFVLLLVLIAILAPWIVPFDPENFFDYDALNAGPSATHWLGVDSLGRDIFSRIIMGARISLAAGFLSVAMGAVVGTFMGLMAGYYQGWWERITMRISDAAGFSRHVAGHRRGGDPRIEHGQRHCRGGGVQRAGLLPAWCAATRWRSSR